MARAKEAIVFCLDIGLGMQTAAPGYPTAYDSAVKVLSMLIQRKIFSESKDEVALVLFGCEETANRLADTDDNSYQNVSLAYPLGNVSFDLLEYISYSLKPGTKVADFLDAVTVSLDILYNETKSKKLNCRRIVLFTNFSHEFSNDSLDGIIGGFSADGMDIDLCVIGPEIDIETIGLNGKDETNDEESLKDEPSTSTSLPKRRKLNHFNPSIDPNTGKPKTCQQMAGEKVVTKMFNGGVNGECYSFSQATKAVTGFEKKSVRSAAWKCHLTLGSELAIPCVAYAKTKEAKLKQTWKKCHAKTHKTADITVNQFYHVEDDQHTEVEKENIGKGYKYGKDIIPFSSEDDKQMKYATEGKSLSILGFTDIDNVPPYLFVDDQALFVLPESGDNASCTSLSAMVLGLQKQHLCAIACYIYRKGTNPKLVALIPHIIEDNICFVMIGLPFSEDVRTLSFASFKYRKAHQPSDKQLQVMDELIDSMDLSDKSNSAELYPPEHMLNPYFQHTFQALYRRSQNPNAALTHTSDNVSTLLKPNNDLMERSRVKLENVQKSFSLQKQVWKKDADLKEAWKKVDIDQADTQGSSSISGLQIAQISVPTVEKVGTVSPDSDFIALLSNAEGSAIEEIFKQLQKKIEEFLGDPFATRLENKIIVSLKTLINHAQKHNQRDNVNKFLHQIKLRVLKTPFRASFVENNIAPIDESVSAEHFWSDGERAADRQEDEEQEDDEQGADELLDMMD